jgi:transposase InsO family protein
MATEEMNVNERYKCVRALKPEYHKATRKEKAQMLTMVQGLTGLSRKYLSTLLHSSGPHRRSRHRERGRIYDDQVDAVIALIAQALDWVCAERLKPVLVEMAEQLKRFGEIQVSDEVMDKLRRISLSSLERALVRVQHLRDDPLPRAHRGRRPETAAEALIPVRVIPWDEPEPGHFEVDTVQHGPPDGSVVYTVQCIDVLTGWSERFAILGKDTDAVWKAFKTMIARCPVPFREVHSDNGPEFVNMALITCFGEELAHITQTRGRKGHSNDNRFVEQKNDTLVRAYLGHLHFYTHQHVQMLNDLYERMGPYYNLFQPVLRQIERKAVPLPDGTVRIVRKQDVAATPLTRLLRAKPPISRRVAEQLIQQRESINPLALHREIHQQLAILYRLAAPDI